MSRKNRNTKRRPQARRRAENLGPVVPNRKITPIPIEKMVVPVGRCYFRSRHGKLRFTAANVESALKQAQHNRAAQGTAHAEKRYYLCDAEGGCGDYHLTSRENYTPRSGS